MIANTLLDETKTAEKVTGQFMTMQTSRTKRIEYLRIKMKHGVWSLLPENSENPLFLRSLVSGTISPMKDMRLTAERLVLGFLFLVILWKGGKALDAVWLLALLAGAVVLLSPTTRFRSLPFIPVALLFGLLAWTIASFFFSTTLNYGFDEVLQAASLTLLTLFTVSRRQEDSAFAARFAQTVSLSGLIACGIGVVIYVLQPVSRFVGTFFDFRFHTDYWPNAWAEFLLLLWPMLLWVLYSRHEKKLPSLLRHDWMKGIVLGFVLGCLLLSYSRGGFIAFFGQAIMLFVFACLTQRHTVTWKRIPVTLLVTVVTSFVIFFGVNAIRAEFHDVQSVIRKATFSSDEGTSSISERKDFWLQALELSSAKPLFGWGPYSFRFVQPHVQRGVLQTSDHPHNVFLKYAAERGIPAAIFFFCIVGLALFFGIRKTYERSDSVPLDLFLVVAIAGVVAHNFIDYNLQFVGIALPFWLSIGLLLPRSRKKTSPVSRRHIERLFAVILLLCTALEGTNLAMSSRARRYEAQGSPLGALRWYALTNQSLFPRDAWLARGAILLSLHQLPQAEEAIDISLGFNEQDGRAWRLLGDIYLRWNKPQDALRAYEKAYVFAKYNDIGILRGLIYLLKNQDAEELLSRRHEFDMLLNEFGLAIEENAHFIALSKNVEDLVALCDILAVLYPEDANAYRSLARRSQNHANEERAKTASRPRGIIW